MKEKLRHSIQIKVFQQQKERVLKKNKRKTFQEEIHESLQWKGTPNTKQKSDGPKYEIQKINVNKETSKTVKSK